MITELKAKLVELKARLDILEADFRAGMIPAAEFADRVAQIQRETNGIQQVIVACESESEPTWSN